MTHSRPIPRRPVNFRTFFDLVKEYKKHLSKYAFDFSFVADLSSSIHLYTYTHMSHQ